MLDLLVAVVEVLLVVVAMDLVVVVAAVVVVETEEKEAWSRFRLTALPEGVRIHKKEVCPGLELNPTRWLHDVDVHVALVRRRLRNRLAQGGNFA